ncbi:MAG: c-type cytochrome biogenesis protein CcsB [Tissierellia bacterium]|jgi:cytochrome c-type biogenesis protein CcsB|nr:c-type cytochrome biogenesis protein CcsB [Tissierellia bacterium]
MHETYIRIENITFTIALLLYLLAMVLYFITIVAKKSLAKPARYAVWLGFFLHTAAIVVRGIGAGRAPLSNQYEFATAFAWGIALFFLLFERKYRFDAMGAFVTPLLFLIMGYASMLSREVRELMPALQSGWLVIHVSMAIIGYGAFAVACGVSLMFLAKSYSQRARDAGLPELEQLDRVSYRAVQFGYLFLTLTIITGAIWAQYAWGRYWAWDPKETWSLVTWIIYTIYLHVRRKNRLTDTGAAWYAVIGFVCVIFTYIGVNTLLPSLHSYV